MLLKNEKKSINYRRKKEIELKCNMIILKHQGEMDFLGFNSTCNHLSVQV